MKFAPMQRIMLFLLTFLPAVSMGQDLLSSDIVPVDEDTKLITYKEVVQCKGTRDSLYLRGIAWINSFYANPSDVTRVRDRENSRIEGLARFKLYKTDDKGLKSDAGVVLYDFRLEFKDGRYRYTLTNFALKEVSRFPLERWLDKKDPKYTPQSEDYLHQVDAYVKDLTEKLAAGMEPRVKKPDIW